MPRNLTFCFTKIKSLSSSSPDPPLPTHPHAPPYSNRPPQPYIKNFNSLYDSNTTATAAPDSDSGSDSAATPDFATAFASKRFFFSSPGHSNSIVDSSLASTSSSSVISIPLENDAVAGGSIAVPTYSPDPFLDFRRSMQEMVEARELHDVREHWDYLHELLMCYLSLNPKSTHKFIVGAFADLLVSLMTPPNAARRNKPISTGKCKIP